MAAGKQLYEVAMNGYSVQGTIVQKFRVKRKLVGYSWIFPSGLECKSWDLYIFLKREMSIVWADSGAFKGFHQGGSASICAK